MKCIAVDDEPLALKVIRDFCSKVEFIDLIGECTSAVTAAKFLNEQKVDLLFLDIQMPYITGLEFIKTIPVPPLTIFTTAFSKYAVEGFEVDAIDYLLKPIPFDRFLKAVNKAYEIFQLRQKNEISYNNQYNNVFGSKDYLLIKVEYSTVKLNLKDILYIEGVKDYVKISTTHKNFLTKSTMKNIEEKLPGTEFIRIHKSYIVSLSSIERIENNRIIFGEKHLPIGEQYKKELFSILNKNRL